MKKIFPFLLSFLLFASPAWAALTRGTPGTLDQDAAAASWTFAVTVASGETVLVVMCVASSASDVFAAGSVTHNGDAMTPVLTNYNAGEASNVGLWERANPDVGTFNVVVTPSASQDGGCIAVPYSGGDTADPTSGEVWEANDGAQATNQDVTCAAGNEVLSAISITNLVTTPTINGGQSSILEGNDGSSVFLFSYEAGSGTNNVGATWTNATGSGHIAVCVNAAAAAAAVPSQVIVVD